MFAFETKRISFSKKRDIIDGGRSLIVHMKKKNAVCYLSAKVNKTRQSNKGAIK